MSPTLQDVGAGAGITELINFRRNTHCVCGVDLDPRVLDHPFLDDAHISDASELRIFEGEFGYGNRA